MVLPDPGKVAAFESDKYLVTVTPGKRKDCVRVEVVPRGDSDEDGRVEETCRGDGMVITL